MGSEVTLIPRTAEFGGLVSITEIHVPAPDPNRILCPHCINGSSIINGGMDSYSFGFSEDGSFHSRSVRHMCSYCGGTGYLKKCPTCGGVGGCRE